MLSGRFLTKLMNNHRNQINLEEEINRNMKGKFKLLGHIGLALFLVSALVLTLAPVAQAATAVTEVWVEFPAEDAAGANPGTYNVTGTEALYRIHFKATTALVRDVDTITLQFPDGVDTSMGASGSSYDFTLGAACSTAGNYDIMVDPYAAGKTYLNYHDCVSASYGGYRLTVTIGVDIPAGTEAWLLIDDADTMVTGGNANTTAYKVKMHTSQDTTPVLSKGFYLGDSGDQVDPGSSAVSVSPSTAGSVAQYTFEWDNNSTGALSANTDTITVTFPYGTTIPSSISASSVQVYNGSWSTCGQAPVVDTDLRTVRVTTPVTIATDDADAAVRFLSTAGIQNPTFGYSAWGFTTTKSRVGFIRTTDAAQDVVCDDDGYTIDESTATTLDFDFSASPTQVTGLSDKYTMINMYSSPLYLQAEDQYGNLCNTGSYVSATVTLTSSSASGNFYYDSNDTEDDGAGTMTLISSTIDLSSGARTVYYKDTAAGTYTLTASTSGLTSATWTIQVCPAVSLYDRYDNLISNFSPTASSPVEESNDTTVSSAYLSGYYLDNAVDAAAAYDKVVLGDGYYEVDSSTNAVSLDEAYITLKSLNGADYTTIGSSEATISWVVRIDADNTTVQDLTFEGDDDTEACDGIYVDAGSFTIQNNKLTGVPNDGIFVESSDAAITAGTITGNTITGIGREAADYRKAIVVETYENNDISGVSITNNTISNYAGYQSAGICVAETGSAAVTNVIVSGNTVSNCYDGIMIYGSPAGMTNTYAVASNTISNCTRGLAFEGSALEPTINFKNNTISGFTKYGIIFNGSSSFDGSNVDIQYNDITGTGLWGIYNADTSSTASDCKYNWWNDATGPSAGTGTYASTTAQGSGEAVTANVTFSPWLHKSKAEVVTDNASYQAANMKLVAGWNTVSTPVKLVDSANSIDELIPSGMTIGYYYDGGWNQITTGYVLNPCDAVYVKMSAVTYVLFKFDAGAFTTPSKALDAGWNLVGLAYLSSAGMKDAPAVASVYSTPANLPGYSQVVSPSMNDAQTDLYGSTSPSSWTYSRDETTGGGTNYMYAGLGYWVYMQNAATLAGFTLTPIVPDLD